MTEPRHPGTFSTLCLLTPAATSGCGATPEPVKSTITRQGRDRLVMRGLFVGIHVEPPPEELSAVIDPVTLMDPQVRQTDFDMEYETIDITGEIQNLALPVLLVTCARDVVASPAEQQATATLFPHAKLVAFSDKGHMLPLEAPERAAREVIRFVHDLG